MIRLICTHCRAMLEMDDGFAGGACRCQHCGTIQTVPSHLKNKSTSQKKSRTLYQNSPAVPSSGLEQLADVVVSSGLTSARLKKPAASPQNQKQPKNLKTLLIGAGALILVLCSTLIYLVTRDHSPSAAPAPGAAATVAPTPGPGAIAPRPSPSFCGIKLDGDTIVYVLDRGDSTRESFDALKSATLKSITTLGAGKKFQILFWSNGHDDGYPKNWSIFATPDNIADAERAIEPISAHGKTDVRSALKNAMAGNPTDVIIVTAKAWDLDDAFVKTVDQLHGASEARIHTIALSDPGASTALQTVAAKTRGTFKLVSDAELKDYGR
jgi:hypothetical protein